mgnify:CR=1 FL=1
MTEAVAAKLKKVQDLISQGQAASSACKKVGLGWPYYKKYTGQAYKKRTRPANKTTLIELPKTTQTPCMLFVGNPTELAKFAREFTQ